jgi:hypothetical protein
MTPDWRGLFYDRNWILRAIDKAEKETYGKLAALLLDQRLKRGVSRCELEESLGVHSYVISKIECCGDCSLLEIQMYFSALNKISVN